MLITPFSYLEMLLGFVGGAVARTMMVAFLILLVGLAFGAVSLVDPLAFIFYVAAISSIFTMLGIIVALWAESFEQLTVLNTFVITPFTYLGGIFSRLPCCHLWQPKLRSSIPSFTLLMGFGVR